MTKQLWPYLAEYSQTFLREIIEPQICSQLPNPFKSFKFLTMDCGDLPFRISGIKVYTKNVGRDKIIIDMDVSYAGDADFTVNFCGLTGGINEIIFSGKLRIVCQPLIPMPPIIAGASFSFIDTPELTFTLTGLGEFANLPVYI
uniref:SMP-LTD domain-containing protein n=1 Tax=Rhabditophanes sp. KR3021 TaxID=114890 RepID=A0AC35TST8_9BILA